MRRAKARNLADFRAGWRRSGIWLSRDGGRGALTERPIRVSTGMRERLQKFGGSLDVETPPLDMDLSHAPTTLEVKSAIRRVPVDDQTLRRGRVYAACWSCPMRYR